MDYCPEIAVLHGAFALLEKEDNSGKCDLLQHTKGLKSSRPFFLIKSAVQEITEGLEKPNPQKQRQDWSRRLHQIFFSKAFIFNKHFVDRENNVKELNKSWRPFQALCAPIPDFHPHLFFELSDEFGWTEYLGELLAIADLPTLLDFASCALEFCSPKPALLYDLSLISVTLDSLVSVCFMEILHSSDSAAEPKKKGARGDTGEYTCGEFASVFSVLAKKYEQISKKHQTHAVEGGQCSEAVESAERGTSESVAETESLQKKANAETGISESAAESSQKKRMDCVESMLQSKGNDSEVLPEKVVKDEQNPSEKKDSVIVTGKTEELPVQEKVPEKLDSQQLPLQEKVPEQLDSQLLDNIARLVDLVTEILALVQRRMSTKLFDRSSCTSGAMANVVHVLGHILASVVVFSVLSFSSRQGQDLRDCLRCLIAEDEIDEDELERQGEGSNANSAEKNTELVASESYHSTNLIAQELTKLIKEAETRNICLQCLRSFFAGQSAKDGLPQKLSTEKSVKFGRVVKLNLKLHLITKPLKTVKVVQDFSKLLATWYEQEKEGTAAELIDCMLAIFRELQRREKIAEERRLNPSLEEVMQKVQKKLPRWKWCLQFGLAKRDLKGWWFAGFLEFLHKSPSVLNKESDVKHLVSVLAEIVQNSDPGKSRRYREMCSELILKMFSQLPVANQGKIILSVYQDTESPALPFVKNFDQSLTVTFNKLSASATIKDLHGALRLAVHDPLAFTQHAVSAAISNHGQIPVIVQVLRLVPGVMTSVHPLHHPQLSLLCHCLHDALLNQALGAIEQKNVLNLVSSLVQTYKTDVKHPPLLSPSEFLSTFALPYISLHLADPPIRMDFALRLLIGCLDATFSVRFSDWLEEVKPAVIVACCARILHEYVELVSDAAEVDRAIKIKSLVLRILDGLHKHFSSAGKSFEDNSLAWLQERCAAYDWTVCAYVSRFLAPASKGENKLLAEFATVTVKQASMSPVALLRLASTGDAAAELVMRALQQSQELLVPQAALLTSLCQVLPHLLVSEVKRVVQVLSSLLCAGQVEFTPRNTPPVASVDEDFTDWPTEVKVSQLLMDATILIILCHSHLSSVVFHHMAQVIVAALQALLQADSNRKISDDLALLYRHMFLHVCVVMSAAHEAMLDPLFVILLDLLARLTPAESSPHTIAELLTEGVELIPMQNLRDTLRKKLKG
ncbi:gem-associated protein 4-like [Littorina saxatilis]|uniref:Uncharacterized protein n=1 Tax=Littorina saxatilis TaxID=31220 RepID=A0AAN9G4N8_9CAEN